MEQESKNKKSKGLVVLGIIAIVVVVAGTAYFVSGSSYETTDNAQLDGNIVPIRSSVTAFIKDIRFDDNQIVKQGDTLIVFDAEELKAKLTQAEAALENANANLRSIENRVFCQYGKCYCFARNCRV